MKEKQKKRNWFYTFFIALPAVLLIYLIVSDKILNSINIKHSEWLTLIVGFLTYYGTIILAYVTVSQNAIISELTKAQLKLQEKNLKSSSRPWFSINALTIFKQKEISSYYVNCRTFDTKHSLNVVDKEFDKNCIYRFKAKKNEFDFYNNTDTPGQVRFSISIENKSKYDIIDMTYNSYMEDRKCNEISKHQIVPCTCKVHCLESGLGLVMNGFQNLKGKDEIEFKYYFHISYFNEYEKKFNDTITLIVYEDSNKTDVVFDLYHDRNTINIEYSEPEMMSLIVNGFKNQ